MTPRGTGWNVAIAAIVLAVVAMLIVPLPTPLLDLLLTLNIGIAVALLMAALFTTTPLAFSSFPTLLVVTTLFRVGLEVSVTRLILADGNAGQVVHAFGSSVVADNLVVGLVVFAVITIVQLVVVARGSERVAEVAARFALDAMPGKQMAIDAELRAGAIDGDTARVRRVALERESQLYGAMDGAMRFVKGDAIAAILIVVINLIGGLVIGVGMHGLSAGDAMRTYSLLSIGEGLVAQIPSLIVAVASGLLVTRVASSGDRALGDDLGVQLGGQPKALAGAAILLVGLGLVPGLPLAPFVLLGGLAAVLAFVAARRLPKPRPALDESGAISVRGLRLELRLSSAIYGKLANRTGELHALLGELRAAVPGIAPPPFAIASDPALPVGEVALALDGAQVAWLSLGSGDPLVALRTALPGPLALVAPELIGIDRVAALVERTAATAPVLVREIVPRAISLAVLADVVRSLAREQVPLDDLTAVLEAIALAPIPPGGFTARDAPALVEQIRGSLRRQISARWAPRGQLAVYTIDGMIEDAVRGAIDRRDGGHVLALEPAIARDIISAVRSALGTGPAVILASGDVRRHLRALLEPELPEIAIVAAHELQPGTAVTTAGRIEVA